MRPALLAAVTLLCAAAAASAGQHRNADGSISDDVLIQSNNQIIGPANPLPVGQPDQRATGTLSASSLNASYGVALANGIGVVGFTVSGLTGSGATLVPEASNDGGTTWTTVNAVSPAGLSTALTTNQQFRVNGGGHTNVRLRVSVAGTGTIAVASSATTVASLEVLSSPAQTTPYTGTLTDTSPTQQSLSGLTALAVRAADLGSLGQWFFQNQSATTLVVVLCNDAGVTAPCASRTGTFLAAPGGGGAQGGSLGWQDVGAWKGRIDVYANAAAAQHTLTRQ